VEACVHWNDNNGEIIKHFTNSVAHCTDEIINKDVSCLNKGNISLFTTIFKCNEHLDSENLFMTLFTSDESIQKFWKTITSLYIVSSFLEIYTTNLAMSEFIDLLFANIKVLDNKDNMISFMETNENLISSIDENTLHSTFDLFRKLLPLANEEQRSGLDERFSVISTNFTMDNIENSDNLTNFNHLISSNLTQTEPQNT
jgi:hypothetical protein